MLHGEHYIEFVDPILPNESLNSSSEVVEVEDKGKGATVVCRVTTKNEHGTIKVVNEGTTFNRGARAKTKITGKSQRHHLPSNFADIIKSPPNFSCTELIPLSQAAVYRLSGDFNPLHMYISMMLMYVL